MQSKSTLTHPKPVRQNDPTGCGLACVACLAGATYADVKEVATTIFNWPPTTRCFYTTSAQIIALLEEFELQGMKGRMVRNWDSISSLAIVAINPRELKKSVYWHWVVFSKIGDKAIVIDPKTKSMVRKNISRIRLRSYIPVERGNGKKFMKNGM